jgi:hypothetical protein
MRALLIPLLVLLCGAAEAQIYRWIDQNGVVHYSNMKTPRFQAATIVDPSSREAAPGPESTECYTIRCQGERMEERLRRQEESEAKIRAERAAAAPKQYRGLEFRKYISIQKGMTEGELLGIAGEPDLKADQGIAPAAPQTVQVGRNLRTAARAGLSLATWTYMPVPGDPFTTTITLVGGRVSDIERVRKF